MSVSVANLETLVSFKEGDFRKLFPNIGFPETIETHHVEDLGFAVVEQDPEPDLSVGETLKPGALRVEDGRVLQAWEVVPVTDQYWPDLIAARRYQAEIAGTAIDGIPLDTGRDSQGLITGAAVQAIIDPAYSLHWKTAEGFVELTGQQILGVASAVRAHVQSCFNREAELQAAVADGSITAEMLEEGWPLRHLSRS